MCRKLLFAFLVLSANIALGQTYSLSGVVSVKNTERPVEFATITIPDYNLWAVADDKGAFTIHRIPAGKTTVHVSCLGFAARSFTTTVSRDVAGVVFHLQEDNLALSEVIITARRKTDEATTTYVIDQKALEHAQIQDVADITTLLPGESTSAYNNLTTARRFALRTGASSENGNASLGTAVEVDGVRISANAAMDDMLSTLKGIDTRSISPSNIESVEVITGVASVEYGDLTNGIVKIETRKGKTPLLSEIILKPNTKQYAISKGFGLGEKGGVLNVHLEHTKSVSDLASPYTSYKRNTLTMTYTKTFNSRKGNPLSIRAGLTGNVGGYGKDSDPDYYRDTYERQRDNVLRGFFEADWMVNKPWLTRLEAAVSVNYNDRLWKNNTYKTSIPMIAAIHSTEEGYYAAEGLYSDNPGAPVVLIPSGPAYESRTWYQLEIEDNKFLNYNAKLKASKTHKWGRVNNRLMLGAEYSRSENGGKGVYYDDMNVAPTWREYRYDELPAMNNLSFYGEERLDIPVGSTSLTLVAGLRSDITLINGSDYGTVSSLSPRFNARYNIPVANSPWMRNISLRAGWGESVKLPTFSVLYPAPSYADRLVFSTGHAYYTTLTAPMYNPDLKWQKERVQDFGADVRLKGVAVSLAYFSNKTINPYIQKYNYTPITYNYTDYAQLDASAIAEENRAFSIDKTTGVVTVSDKTGALPDEQLAYTGKNEFKANRVRSNGSPVRRKGVEWIVDIDKIHALQTSFRIDGKYYYYKWLEESVFPYYNSTSTAETPYVAHYVGSSNTVYNGTVSRQLNTNLTITTHIPKVRLIVSLRIESSLYNSTRNLSEYRGQRFAFVYDKETSTFDKDADIYGGDRFVAVCPLYYSTHDDPHTMIPFAEKLEWARDNDTALYNELYKMIKVTNTNYTFNANRLSAYYSANLSVTKEIGKHVGITFKADNFLNNMGKIRSGNTGRESSLYGGSYIPRFYYGLSLTVKI